jgi:malate dehydrogenase (oxaloacetate-decarboxylating)
LPTLRDKQAMLLPPITDARRLARLIARAVGKQAIQDGQTQLAGEHQLDSEIDAMIWEPVYVPYERKQPSTKLTRDHT